MREPEDMEEAEVWRDEEPPPRACPECGDDDRHAPDCSRNYRNIPALPTRTHDRYWLGYRHGQRLAEHEPHIDHLPALRWEARFSSRPGRAFALGELRGYRQAAGIPNTQATVGHKVIG